MNNNDNGVSEKVIFWGKKKVIYREAYFSRHGYRHGITNTTLHPGLKPAFLQKKQH